MPLAALARPRRAIFLAGFARTHYCPTFKGEIYSLAAAKAAIGIYRAEPVAEHIWTYGERLRAALHGASGRSRRPRPLHGAAVPDEFVFDEPDPMRRRLKRTLLMQELLKNRIVTVTGMFLPSHGAR